MSRIDDEINDRYWDARLSFEQGNLARADLFYRQLRRDYAVDLYYEVELPENLKFVHPLGTVLGRATYGDYLAVYQNVGVGSDLDGNRPTIGEGVVLFPGAKILGKTKIGNNVFVTANTVVQDVSIPDDSIVFPNRGLGTETCDWKPTRRSVKKHFFK